MLVDDALLGRVAGIAREAGEAIMVIYRQGFAVQEKADCSPLTEADMAAHRLIGARLTELEPALPVLSEEGDTAGFVTGADGCYWLVDPLDGTREFVKRNGEFTVNIALIAQGRPVLAVVYAPALDVLYQAAEGLGAFKVLGEEVLPLHIEGHHEGSPWRVVGSRSHAGDSLAEWLGRLGEYELVPMGSSLKFCLVAEGRADVYPRFGPTSLWDTAAAQCVVEQAGGVVVDRDGHVLSYADVSQCLNPHFIVCSKADVEELLAIG